MAPATMIDYEKNIKKFFKEHLHEHEEIRLILGGGGELYLVLSGFSWCVYESCSQGCASIQGGRQSTKTNFCRYPCIDWQGMRTFATLMDGGYGFTSRKAT